jgi:hypothetical protein
MRLTNVGQLQQLLSVIFLVLGLLSSFMDIAIHVEILGWLPVLAKKKIDN